MTSILVTGGAGYVGSHTCKALRRAGFDPITYDNLARGSPESVKWGVLEMGELADSVHLRETLMRYRAAAVVHFAALAYVGESNVNPTRYYQNNVGGTATLLDAMRQCGVSKIVFSSGCAVYGTPEVVPIPEETHSAPINPYGATKMICERMLKECAAAFPLSLWRCAISMPPARTPKEKSASVTFRKPMPSHSCLRRQQAKARASRYSVTIIQLRTAPVSAITST
jgi:UDP-arabinose 4-epimerase